MALYGIRHDGAEIRFWYGVSEAAPVIAFLPIRLADLLQP
jgi:hypothetical protein